VHNNQQLIANNQTNWCAREGEKSDREEQRLKQEPTLVMTCLTASGSLAQRGLDGRGAVGRAKASSFFPPPLKILHFAAHFCHTTSVARQGDLVLQAILLEPISLLRKRLAGER